MPSASRTFNILHLTFNKGRARRTPASIVNGQSSIARKTFGFSLIELLVVISIIGILTSIGAVSFSNAQMKGRDARRKADLVAIQQALELYYQANDIYLPTKNDDPPAVGNFLRNMWLSGTTSGAQHALWLRPCNTHPTDCPQGFPALPALSPTHISKVPIDPINVYNDSTEKGYTYAYKSNNHCPNKGYWYVLATVLENKNDPDVLANKDLKWCVDGTTSLRDFCLSLGPDNDCRRLYIIFHKR